MLDDRKDFIQALLKKKVETEAALTRLLEAQKERTSQMSDDLLSDEFDSAQREVSVQAQYRLIEKKTGELKRINSLLTRFHGDEEFGICEECGDPIPPARLLIVPDATLCVACQQEAERGHRARSVCIQAASLPNRKHWDWEPYLETDAPDLGDDSLGDGLEVFEFDELSGGSLAGPMQKDLGGAPGEKSPASAA